MQLRFLEEIKLLSAEEEKKSNGIKIKTYSDLESYLVIIQDVMDDISVSMYGSNISKMKRISSPLQKLEEYLMNKMNNSNDNISNYAILYKNTKYKITAVKKYWIDIEKI